MPLISHQSFVVNESTAARRRLIVYLAQADGTPVEGAAPTGSQLSVVKNADWDNGTNAAGTWTEFGGGFYSYQFTQAELDTVGSITLGVTVAPAEPTLVVSRVNPNLDAAITALGLNLASILLSGVARPFDIGDSTTTTIDLEQAEGGLEPSGQDGAYVGWRVVTGDLYEFARRVIAYDELTHTITVTPAFAAPPTGTLMLVPDVVDAVADPLESAVPGGYAAGSAGYRIGQLGSGISVVSAPVALDGTVAIIRGDDYLAANGRALEWSDPGGNWPDLTGAEIAFLAATPHQAVVEIDGTVVDATTPGKVRVELPRATTAALLPTLYEYDLQATLTGGSIVTLAQGQMAVRRDIPQP